MPIRLAAWPLIRTFLWISGSCGRIRSGSRVGTVRRIRSAIHENAMAMVRAGGSRRVPWHQSGDGMVVCRCPGTPGEESAGRQTGAAPYSSRACAVDWGGCPGRGFAPGGAPGAGRAVSLCGSARRVWSVAPGAGTASTLGRDAGGFSGSHAVVVSDGLRTWGGIDVGASPVAVAGARRVACPPDGGVVAPGSGDLPGTRTRCGECAYPQPLSGDQCRRLAGV